MNQFGRASGTRFGKACTYSALAFTVGLAVVAKDGQAQITRPRTGAIPSSGAAAAAAAAARPAAAPVAAAPAPAANATDKVPSDTNNLAAFEKGVEFIPKNPNERITFSFEEADLVDVVRTIGNITGRRFIISSKVKNIKSTLYSPTKISAAEAYQAFLSILETNALTVVPHGRFLKIVETAGIQTQTTPTYTHGTISEDRFVTRLHRLTNVSAEEAMNVLNKFKSKDADITVYSPGNLMIITDTGANIKRMMSLLDQIDVGGAGEQIFIEPIHYASAQEVATRVNDLFDIKAGSGGGVSANPKGGPPIGAAAAGGGGGGGPAGDLRIAKIVADDRSNALIIVATERAYLRVLELVKRIDVPQTGEGEIHVLPLQHAEAIDLAKTLNEIITASGPTSSAGGGRGQPAAGPAVQSSAFEGQIRVTADKATNAIVITSSLRDYAHLRTVVERLDRPRRQVFIEAVILDLQLKRRDSLGVSFHGGKDLTFSGEQGAIFGGNKILNTLNPIGAPVTDPDALQGFALGLRGPSAQLLPGVSLPAFGAFLQALASSGDSDLLSTPHILALDNEDAEINVGDNVPLQANAPIGLGALGALGGLGGAAGAGGAGGLGALGGLGGLSGLGGTVPRDTVGTKLKIKPHLNDSDEVRLDVTEDIKELGANVGGTSQAFQIATRTAQTKLVVRDQQTVVIGGLIRNAVTRTEEKVPILGDIPVLGMLFRKRSDTNEKRNLVLILTPYIIRNQDDLRAIFERKMQERQEYLDRYFVFSDSTEYTPARDFARTNGLVEEIRQAMFEFDEKKRLDELTKPKQLKSHDPQKPLEMPAVARPSGAATTAAQAGQAGTTPPPAMPSPGSAPLNVQPPVRNIDKLEK